MPWPLAHSLSAQLREAQSRINQLEFGADKLAARLWAEAECAVLRLQSDANARVERLKREADEYIARVKAEVESCHSDGELAEAKQLTGHAKADARIAPKCIAGAETDTNERLSRAWAEIETRLIRLS